MTRRAAALIGVGVVVLSAPALLWAIASSATSVEQRVADAEPLAAPLISTALEERVLQETVVVRGEVVAEDAAQVLAPDLGDAAPIVTSLPKGVGDPVEPGEVVAVVADRPVFAMPMALPLYRDIEPFDRGPDVERLQGALVDLGLDLEVDGVHGPKTQSAVALLYDRAGYEPARSDPAAEEHLDQLEEAVSAAKDAYDDARRSADRLERRREAASSEDEASDDSPPGGTDPGHEEALADARLAVTRAARQLEQATATMREARRRVGIRVPAGELQAVDAWPAVVTRVEHGVGEHADGPVLALSGSALLVRAAVEPALGRLLEPGAEAVASGDVALVVAANHERDDSGRAVILLEPRGELPSAKLGQELRVEVTLAGSQHPVLAAPIAAIREDAQGTHVRVVDEDDTVVRVDVRPGMVVGGWVEILHEQDLKPGTKVQVG